MGYRDPEEIVSDAYSPKRALSKRARQGVELARGVDEGEEEQREKYRENLREVSRNVSSPYRGRQQKTSPVKAQYEDFKVKFGITAEHEAIVSMSPESKKSKWVVIDCFREGDLQGDGEAE